MTISENLPETRNTTAGLTDLIARLSEPFPPEAISWRVGATNRDKTKGIALAYLDARDVMRRLDEVNPAWQCRYSHVGQYGVVCEIGLLVDGVYLWRANGAGQTDVEAEKGALSDAFKRAAVCWGVGRYLYDLDNVWVPLVDGKRLAETPKLPDWAKPGGAARTGEGETNKGARSDALADLSEALNESDGWKIWALSQKDEQAFRFAFGRLNSKQKALCRELEVSGATLRKSYIEELTLLVGQDDESGVRQLVDELPHKQAKELVWSGLTDNAKKYINRLYRSE
jgi:hypothetical protein